MSNPLAVATVTLTLRNLLVAAFDGGGTGGLDITTKPPDKARTAADKSQLNLFLYQTTIDPAWRNADLPGTVGIFESGHPPLPLVLHYLLTAYGANDDDLAGQRLLARAMLVLHDHPLLGREEIRVALADNDLHEQVERVRVTPEFVTLDDLSKLWTAFQTGYRISATYQVSAVLLHSNRNARTPAPVLRRGEADRGPEVSANLDLPFPRLLTVRGPGGGPVAGLGETVTITGTRLDGTVAVRLHHPRLKDPLTPPVAAPLRVTVPDDPIAVPAGVWTVDAVVSRPDQPDRTTNTLPLAVEPRITTPLPLTVARDGDGDVTITVTCRPSLRSDQGVFLLIGDRQVARTPPQAAANPNNPSGPPQPPPPTDTAVFVVVDADAGEFLVRLRVDGVDSQIIDRSKAPPEFDENAKVIIT
jgi:Pvc16 N-terminal domain